MVNEFVEFISSVESQEMFFTIAKEVEKTETADVDSDRDSMKKFKKL